MKSEWRIAKLSSLVEMGNGRKRPLLDGDYPVYGGNGVMGYAGQFNSCNCIVVGRVGAYCGNVHRCVDKCWVSDNAIKITVKDSYSFDFVYYLMQSVDFHHHRIGGAQPLMTQEIIGRQQVAIPSLPTQRKIAAVLSSLDDQIETNNAICHNLEEQADALFNNCIEEGNKQVPFLSLVEVQGGGTPKTGQSEYWSGEIPFYTPKDVSVPFTFETGKSLTRVGLSHCNSPLYPAWTTFVTARGTVGKLAMAGLPMAMNQSCYALVGKKIHPILAFMYSRSVVRSLKKKSTGSVFDAIVTRDFETEKVKRLSDERKFIDVALPMYERIYILMQENNRLAALRDTLLPRLMSGELDVSAVNL